MVASLLLRYHTVLVSWSSSSSCSWSSPCRPTCECECVCLCVCVGAWAFFSQRRCIQQSSTHCLTRPMSERQKKGLRCCLDQTAACTAMSISDLLPRVVMRTAADRIASASSRRVRERGTCSPTRRDGRKKGGGAIAQRRGVEKRSVAKQWLRRVHMSAIFCI